MKLYTEEQVRELLKEIFKDDFFKGEDIIPIILGKELTPIELPSDEEMHPVKAVQEDGDWFLIPNELYQEFNEDTYNEELVDSGGFDDKWWKYKTGGDLNLIQLFAKIQGGNK